MLYIKSSAVVQKAPFKDLNLTFGDKGLVFICGKKESSAKNLIKYIGGVEYLSGLNIQIDDFILDDAAKLDDYRLHNIGFIFSNVQYIEGETILANVLSSSSLFTEVLEDSYIDECLAKVGLLEHKNCPVSELSEYELHCLDIARALVKDPKVLLANNPIARLNAEDTEKIWKIIEELSKDYLIIVGNALRAKAKQIANTIVSFEANEVNHVLVEKIEVIPNIPYKNENEPVKKHYEKVNQFTFKNLFKISSSLLKGGIFLMVLLAVTITVFLMSASATNNSHENFAKTLNEQNINKVIMMRNTSANDYVISQEVRDNLDKEFSELTIQWGYYLAKDVSELGYEAHSRATGYSYPESIFKIQNDEKDSFYELVYGSWDNSSKGVYISESEAQKYIDYINEYSTSTRLHAEVLKKLFDKVYPEGKKINSVEELVGEKLILAYNTKNLTVLEVAGVFKDNFYSNNLIITQDFTFPNLYPNADSDPNTKEDNPFDQSQFYSIGIVTLTDDVEYNTRFFEYNATIIRDEKESVIIMTDLDEEYGVLYNEVSSLVTPLNVSAIILSVLTIAGSVIYSALLIANYRKELTLSRTYGLQQKEIFKVSAILNACIAAIALVAGIVLTIIAQIIYNIVLKGKYAFLALSYFTAPVYAIILAVVGAAVFAAIFIVLSVKALKKNDYLVY